MFPLSCRSCVAEPADPEPVVDADTNSENEVVDADPNLEDEVVDDEPNYVDSVVTDEEKCVLCQNGFTEENEKM